MQKYILSFIFILCFSNTAMAVGGVLQGLGTEASPFLIDDYEDLKVVNDDLTAYYRLTDDINAGGSALIIGYGSSFTGNFDGDSHKVFNLRITKYEIRIGLFSTIGSTGIVKNLGVKGNVTGRDSVGILAGVNEGDITNCYSIGEIDGSRIVTGGLVGHNEGTISKSFTSVFNKGSGGGLVGKNQLGSVSESFASGKVNSGGGLILSSINGSVNDCYSVTSVLSNDGGGLIQTIDGGSVVNSYSYGRVNNENGGLIGDVANSPSIVSSYWNIELSTANGSASEDGVSYRGLTNSEMSSGINFTGWAFSSVWEIANGAFPGLVELNDPPVGVVDITNDINDTLTLAPFLSNDVDVEGVVSGSLIARATGYKMKNISRDSLYYTYTPGEILTSGDTLWGVETQATIAFEQIEIATYADLKKIGVASDFPLDGYYVVTGNIDAIDSKTENGGEGFVPIGNWVNQFKGTFIGNGFYVYNFNINRPFEDYMGLFGAAGEQALIEDFGVIGKVVGRNNVGLLIGANQGKIERVYSHGMVKGDGTGVGGIIGYHFFWDDNCEKRLLWQMYSSAYVTNIDTTSSVGGVIGRNGGGCIQDVYSTGFVEGKVHNDPRNGTVYAVGGIVGVNGALKRSFFNGIILTNDQAVSPIGSINPWSVKNSYWNSFVTWDYQVDPDTIPCKGFSPSEMLVQDSFALFDFINIWMTQDNTYPLLRNVPNGPVGVMDVSDTLPNRTDFQQFIVNDISPTLEPITEASFNGDYKFNASRDSLYLFYRPGYIIGVDDTVWGGVAHVAAQFDTINIANYSDLKKIGSSYQYPIDGNYKLIDDIDAKESIGENGGLGFKPIGDIISPFNGSLNGNGHEITNLFIKCIDCDNIGLFGFVGSTGIVEDLNVSVEIHGRYNTGALAGNNKGIIKSVQVQGKIQGEMYVGGIVGHNEGELEGLQMSGSVTGRGTTGGVVGKNWIGTVGGSKNYAIIYGMSSTGGIVGDNQGTIYESYNNGVVNGTSSVGGLAGKSGGYKPSLIVNSYNTGRIIGSVSVGGVMGSSQDTLRNVYSIGQIECGGNCGGLIGYDWYDLIENSFWATDLSGQLTSSGSGVNYEGSYSGYLKSTYRYDTWNFQSIWRMSHQVSFPALRNVINAPVAIADTVNIYGKTDLKDILVNDVNIQTFVPLTFFRVDSIYHNGITDSLSWYSFPESTLLGAYDTLVYRSGMVYSSDTVWSNQNFVVLISAENTKPDANDNNYTINEGDTLVVAINDLLLNDVDVDSNSIIEFDSLITDANSSSMINVVDDSIVFKPTENWNGTLRIPYVITDGMLQDTADLVFTVNAVNDPTTFTDVSPKQIDEDDQIVFDPSLSNALNVDGDILEYFIESGSNYIVNGMTVKPDDNYNGILVVPVRVYDGDDTTASVTWMVTVDAVNDSPVMTQIDIQTIDEDASLSITLSITDAQDVDGDSLEVILVAGANYGIEGTIVKPRSNFFGDITVGVKVTDGIDTTGAFPLALTVLPINDVPVITNVLSDTIVEDTRFAIADLDITATDVEGESVTTVVKDGVDYVVIGDSIVPASNFNGELTVSVQVEDGIDSSAVFAMALTVSSVDDPMIFTNLIDQTIHEDSSLIFNSSMSDAQDVDDVITVLILSGVHYTVNGIEIIPDQNYNGQLVVPIRYTNGRDTTATLNLGITVEPVNDIPVVVLPQKQKIKEDATIELLVSMVTIMDPDGSAFQIIINSGDNYTFDGTVVYPMAHYNGLLQVPIQVTDGVDTSSTELITVEVQPVNDAPVILSADTVRVQQGELIVIDNSHIQMVDVEGDLLSIILGTGEFYDIRGSEIVPEDGYVGDLAVSIRVTDGVSISEFYTVPVVISPLNLGDDLLSSAHSIVSSGSTVNAGVSSNQRDTTLIAVPEVIPEDTVSAPIQNSGNQLFETNTVSVINMLENSTRTRLAPNNTTYFVLYNLRGQFISEGEIHEGTFTIPTDINAHVLIVKFYKGYLK